MKKKSMKEIKDLFQEELLQPSILEDLRQDPRKGVQKLLEKYDKQQLKKQELKKLYEQKLIFEQQFLMENEYYIAGVDEAGRGPLAGPVVAAAVILPDSFKLYGLNDSKKVTPEKRQKFYHMIKEEAIAYHIAVVGQEKIDEINIYEATKLAMMEAIHMLHVVPHIALIDAVTLTNTRMRTKSIIKGDMKSIAIAAASILAKVTRDQIMQDIHHEYPMYGFSKHMGYGTKEHIAAIQTYGPCVYHRKSFSPVREKLHN